MGKHVILLVLIIATQKTASGIQGIVSNVKRASMEASVIEDVQKNVHNHVIRTLDIAVTKPILGCVHHVRKATRRGSVSNRVNLNVWPTKGALREMGYVPTAYLVTMETYVGNDVQQTVGVKVIVTDMMEYV